MSPILFNFASNVILAAAEQSMEGIKHPGQEPLRAIAFADETVFGLASSQDRTAFKIKYTMDAADTVFCHLDVLFSKDGLALPENEAKILADLVN
ncbi:hypothetical protein DSO57_1022500 [Entomophthora muscae]|uniref:Uncharacterized protein n=1 Tax=Entomophthora muscae TaxID=34485 RepID=A0ACC2UPJ9_9FUNG|nr:hypothetical protein DSO57_1022500 [Entomophthora muscae]